MCLGSRFEDTTQHGEEVWTTDGDRSVHLRPLPMSPRVKKQRAGNAGVYVPGFLLPRPLLFSVSSWSVDWYCLDSGKVSPVQLIVSANSLVAMPRS